MDLAARRHLFQKSLPLILVLIATTGWNFLASGRASLSVLLFFVGLLLACMGAGSVLVACLFGITPRSDSFSIRLLIGFLAINIVMYLLILALPFGIEISAILIATIAFVAWKVVGKKKPITSFPPASRIEIFFILLSLLAASLWCQDLFQPVVAGASETTVRGWSDIFFHLRQISVFAFAKGAASISDFQMAGAPAHAYHYASYVLPSALMAMTPSTAVQAYGGTFVPFGLFLTALAAFSLLASLMGKWPGAAAGLALLFVPDALQQGFGNAFLSYHWLQHIGPTGLYGIAIIAVAWLLMFEGCREQKLTLVGAAYIVALCSVMFKAQLFVANAYLILVFPAFFITGLERSVRRIFFYAATALFLVTIYLTQSVKSIPVMRLDGTGIQFYADSLLSAQNQGLFHPFVAYAFQSTSGIIFILATAVILLFGTFGIWAILYPLLVTRLKQKLAPSIVLFPLLVMVNYLVMSQGLASDSHAVGRPEELLHRPFVWAYFVVCSWSAAGLYFLLFGNTKPTWHYKGRLQGGEFFGLVATLVAVLALGVPAYFGHNIHSLALWRPNVEGVKLDTCLVNSAEFIRTHSQTFELIQDSSNDPDFALTALAERQAFAIDASRVRAPDGVYRRLGPLNYKLKNFKHADEVLQFVNQNSITWYLRRPKDKLLWPDSVEQHVAYRCGDYRVYHFKTNGQ